MAVDREYASFFFHFIELAPHRWNITQMKNKKNKTNESTEYMLGAIQAVA